jgi:Sulfotransferase family/Aspartyl/Asparaginyl beta-hydroxylase
VKLPVPFIQLPLQFDAEVLAREIAAFGADHWREHPQKYPGNLWLPLVSVDGDPDNDSFSGPMRPTTYLLQCPYLMQALSRIGAVWGRTRLMMLTGQAEVGEHFDINYYWRGRARVHVPIVTQPSVRFICGEGEVNMKPGECWIFDTWRKHRVINASDVERIHLVGDTVGSDEYGELVRNGQMPGNHVPEGWRAEVVAPTDEQQPALRYESVNIPVVMTPWEMREHISFLFREVRPHAQLEPAQQVTARFLGAWQALWSEFGTDPAGWPAYRQALDTYEQWLGHSAASLQLINDASLLHVLRLMVFSVAISDSNRAPGAGELRQTATPAIPVPRVAQKERDPLFDRPVFIMSPPRSGSTLLFETLAKAPNLFTIGRESHALIEGLPGLHPRDHDYDSNRLDATAATPMLTEELRRRFLAELRDRNGHASGQRPIRLLEKTPKNALRVPFLTKIFPEARFVYLYRDARETLSSMIEAWESGRFRTYPKLPGWEDLPWSLLLVPGWRELDGRSLQEIVAAQWETTTRTLLDDLDALPPGRCHVARYDAFLANPADEVARLCEALEIDWDLPLDGALPLSRYTVSDPSSDKWRRHEALIEQVLPGLQVTLARAEKFAMR